MSSKNSPSEPFYISLEVVLELHQRQLREFGGADGVRNRSGLESAVETPKSTFDGQDLYLTIYLKAAAYAFQVNVATIAPMNDRLNILCDEIKQIHEQYVLEVGTGGRKVWPNSLKQRALEVDRLVGSLTEPSPGSRVIGQMRCTNVCGFEATGQWFYSGL